MTKKQTNIPMTPSRKFKKRPVKVSGLNTAQRRHHKAKGKGQTVEQTILGKLGTLHRKGTKNTKLKY